MKTTMQDFKDQLESLSQDDLVPALLTFMKQRGDTNYDESVTQLEHALQCAQLARERGMSSRAVTSALFHDIGHLLVAEHDDQAAFLQQDLNHEEVGATFLAERFPRESVVGTRPGSVRTSDPA